MLEARRHRSATRHATRDGCGSHRDAATAADAIAAICDGAIGDGRGSVVRAIMAGRAVAEIKRHLLNEAWQVRFDALVHLWQNSWQLRLNRDKAATQ